jgi:hypothetical protein
MGQLISSWCGACSWGELIKFNPRSSDEVENNTPKWKKMPFHETFREAIKTMDLSIHAKTIITLRYMEIVLDIQKKNNRTLKSYTLHRVTILVSGILVPVLFSVTNDIPNQAALFWITLTLSIAGSISSAWIEYFQMVKLHYTYLSVSSNMESEGWYFSSLSGPYKKYRRHDQCWRKFISNVEKIHASGINSYMLNSQPSNAMPSGKELIEETGLMVGHHNAEQESNFTSSESYAHSEDFDPNDFVIRL